MQAVHTVGDIRLCVLQRHENARQVFDIGCAYCSSSYVIGARKTRDMHLVPSTRALGRIMGIGYAAGVGARCLGVQLDSGRWRTRGRGGHDGCMYPMMGAGAHDGCDCTHRRTPECTASVYYNNKYQRARQSVPNNEHRCTITGLARTDGCQ